MPAKSQNTNTNRSTARALAARLVFGFALASALAPAALAQPRNPVYVDDAPGAVSAISRALDTARAGNHAEAVRVLQRLLSEEGDRLVPTPEDPDLFRTIRRAVLRAIRDDEELLRAYRDIEEPAAARLLSIGRADEAERAYLLTPSGFEATLRLTQARIESARFDSAWRTLLQLDDHPDRRTPQGALAAAELLSVLARYHQPDADDGVVERWRADAGLPAEAPDLVRGPDGLDGRSPLDPAPTVELEGLVATPLRSDDLGLWKRLARSVNRNSVRSARDLQAAAAQVVQPFVLPTIAGDLIYLNDGVEIGAWERFSLAPVWTRSTNLVDGDVFLRSAGQRPIEDVGSVTVQDGWAVAATGVAMNGTREGDVRIQAFDALTGEPRWAVAPQAVDPMLTDASVRGPLVIDQSVVVASFAKQVRERRLIGVYMVGFDLHTGDRLWTRQLGSTGSLPYGTNVLQSEGATADAGVVYRGDRLGFLAAVDSVTGRTQWIRRMPVVNPGRTLDPAWEISAPIVMNGVVYALSPDRETVVALDARTGEQIVQRSRSSLGDPVYMMASGDRLLFVGDSVITSLRAADFADPAVRADRVIGPLERRMRGRVIASDTQALVPVVGGVIVVSLADGTSKFVPLDYTGNVLATPSQLVVVDEAAMHSYLLWDVAQRLLTDRMDSEPDDPGPAATLAELAYRAGRPAMIVPAVDVALAAIERAPMDDRNALVRAALFESALQMVQPRVDERTVAIPFDDQVSLLERLDRLASSSEQRVRRLMAAGALYEVHAMPARAVDAYQRILSEPALASASIEIDTVVRQAGEESTRKLRGLIRRYGHDVYAVYEGEAARRLALARENGDAEDFLDIAERYPMARSAVEAWLLAGELLVQSGRTRLGIVAYEDGLRAAEDAVPRDDELIGRLASPLLGLLIEHGRIAAARDLVASLQQRWPRTRLAYAGRDQGLAEALSELQSLAAALDRRPDIGLTGDEAEAIVLPGWRLVTPLLTDNPGRPTSLVLLRTDDMLGLWESSDAEGLSMRWSTPLGEADVAILIDDNGVLLSRFVTAGRNAVLLSIETGEPLWTSAAIGELFEEWADGPGMDDGPRRTGRGAIETPLSLRRPAREVLIVVEGQTVAFVDRVGRCAAFDRRTGRTLWSKRTLDRVHDVVAGDGALAIAGATQVLAAAAGDEADLETAFEPTLTLFDTRTGREIGRFRPEGGRIRWARVSDDGDILIGLDDAIAAYSPAQAERRWLATGPAAGRTVDAWVFPGRLIVLNNEDELRQFALADGSAMRGVLEDRGRMRDAGSGLRPVRAATLGDVGAFATAEGIVLYNNRGDLVGCDQRSSDAEVVGAAFGQDYVVILERQVISRNEEGEVYPLSFFTADSAALVHRRPVRLGAAPDRIAAIDGRILISAGGATVIVPAKPPAPPPRSALDATSDIADADDPEP